MSRPKLHMKSFSRHFPSNYYDNLGYKMNPVYVAIDTDIEDFYDLFRKRMTKSKHGRRSMNLFEMLQKYRPLLPEDHLTKKIIQIGRFLIGQEEYVLALSCYNFYFLVKGINSYEHEEFDLEAYKTFYFPKGIKSESARYMIEILVETYYCLFQLERHTNRMSRIVSTQRCQTLLLSYKMLTQVLIQESSYCWLLYNCTVHIYQICCELITFGHASKALEHLLWACTCMEDSTLLQNAYFLCWRCTLYRVACLCYSDCRAGDQLEVFCRRALCKISDVWAATKKHDTPRYSNMAIIIRECTLKMSIVMFKRMVYEMRRRVKGANRLKHRPSDKDMTIPWPRTNTEKLLGEMFDCEAAQFLAILESLEEPQLRLYNPAGVFRGDSEMADVCAELLVAAREIVSGNANPKVARKDSCVNLLRNVVHNDDFTLMEMAVLSEDKVPLRSLFRVATLAFTYQQWSIYSTFANRLVKIEEANYALEVKKLDMLNALLRILQRRKGKKLHFPVTSSITVAADVEDQEDLETTSKLGQTVSFDELSFLCQELKSVMSTKFVMDKSDKRILQDVTCFIWNQVRPLLRKHQIGLKLRSDFFQKWENGARWLPILDTIFTAMSWCEVALVELISYFELTMRLALLLENYAEIARGKKNWKHRETKEMIMSRQFPSPVLAKEKNAASNLSVDIDPFFPTDLQVFTTEDFLWLSRLVLMKGLENFKCGRALLAEPENQVPKSAFNIKNPDSAETSKKFIPKDHLFNIESQVCHSMRDIHTELAFVYCRVVCKLNECCADTGKMKSMKISQKKKRTPTQKKEEMSPVESLWDDCGSNHLLKAILKMQSAEYSLQPIDTLKESLNFIIKFQKQIARMFGSNAAVTAHDKEKVTPKTTVPLPPIILWRTTSTIGFKLGKFCPKSGEKVCWYRMFAHVIETHFTKVRINDTPVPGTGDLIPASHPEIIVQELKPDKMYAFALAAYSEDGTLIGDSIGESTPPILVSHSLSVPLAYTFLCQKCYELKCYSLAEEILASLRFYLEDNTPSEQLPVSGGTPVIRRDLRICSRMCIKVMSNASPIFLRQLHMCCMMSMEMQINISKLHAESFCHDASFTLRQIKHINEIQKLFFPLDIGTFLNDSTLCAQTLVQMYGLLIPFLYFSCNIKSTIEMFLYCVVCMHALPPKYRLNKPAPLMEGIRHIAMCAVYHLVKMLFAMKEPNLAVEMAESGFKALQEDLARKSLADSTGDSETQDTKCPETRELFSMPYSKVRQVVRGKSESGEPVAKEELIILEEAIAALYKADSDTSWNREEDCIGLSSLSIMSSKQGSKELMKYKKKPNQYEFSMRVIRQALAEKEYTLVETYCEELQNMYCKKVDMQFRMKADYMKRANDRSKVKERSNSLRKIFSDDPPELENLKMRAMIILTKYVKGARLYLCRKYARSQIEKELPFKCQTYLMQAVASINALIEKYELFHKVQPNFAQYNLGKYLDYNWISYNRTGLFLDVHASRKGAGWPKSTKVPDEKAMHSALRSMGMAFTKNAFEITTGTTYESLSRTMILLSRALVLAHRGELWSTLQNIAKIFLDIMHVIREQFVGSQLTGVPNSIYITHMAYKSLTNPTLITCSDLLLDMMAIFKRNQEKLRGTFNPPTLLQPKGGPSLSEERWNNLPLNSNKLLYGLHFEPSCDDTRLVDIRLIELICKKSFLALYHMQKWERQVDFILRFNYLTNDKNAEFTTPLLINAQLNLDKLHKDRDYSLVTGINLHVTNPDGSLNPRRFLDMRFIVSTGTLSPVSSSTTVGGAVSLNVRENTVYKDIESSWKYVLSMVDRSDYVIRCVLHSRQLLHLFLAGIYFTKMTKGTGEEVELRPKFLYLANVLEPLPSPELHLNFESPGDSISATHASNLTDCVLGSYSQTISLLMDKQEKDIAAQMLSEMGHVQLMAGDHKAALQSWITSLELILRLNKTPVSKWRQVFTNDPDLQLFKTCGPWGCLLGGTIASFISRYCVVGDIYYQVEFCFLSYHLYKAIFRSSLTHPQKDVQFSLYNVGEHCMQSHIIPDVPLLGSHYRCPARQLAFALRSMISTLYVNGYYLMMLPLISLFLYLSRVMFRDLKLYVQGQILRMQAHTKLHMFTEASIVHYQLVTGLQLPQQSFSLSRTFEPKMEQSNRFESSANLSEPHNLKFLHFLCRKPLPVNLTATYGLDLTNRLQLAIIQLIITIAECINVIPEDDDNFAVLLRTTQAQHDSEPETITQNIFINPDGSSPPDRTKSLLLHVASHKLDTLMSDLLIKNKNFLPPHIDMKIMCMFERSRILAQKHHFYFAARMCRKMMEIMHRVKVQDSPMPPTPSSATPTPTTPLPGVRPKIVVSPSESVCSDSRFVMVPTTCDGAEYLHMNGPILWMTCRLKLVDYLNSIPTYTEHDCDFGEVKKSKIGSISDHCTDGQQEARVCNDFEKEAAFIYMEAIHYYGETHNIDICRDLCQKGVNVIQQCTELSNSGLKTLLKLLLLQTDLLIKSNTPLSIGSARNALDVYRRAKELAENRLQTVGINIKEQKKLPNVYLTLLGLLTDIDLRVALLSVKCSRHKSSENTDAYKKQCVLNALDILKEAILISQSVVYHRSFMQIELHLQTGKIQRLLGDSMSPSQSLRTFVNIIKLESPFHHHTALIRGAYLEMALTCISQLNGVHFFTCQRFKARVRREEDSRLSLVDPQKEKYIAMLTWMLIRSAAILSSRHIQKKLHQNSPTLLSISDIPPKYLCRIPDFMNLEILGKFVFGKMQEKKSNTSVSDKDPLQPAKSSSSQVLDDQSCEEEMMKSLRSFSFSNLNFMHIFDYFCHLSDLLHYNLISINEILQDTDSCSKSNINPESFYKVFLYSMGINPAMRNSYTNIYSFLNQNWPFFSVNCATINLPTEVDELWTHVTALMDLGQASFFEVAKTMENLNMANRMGFPGTLPSVKSEEVAFQWYSCLFMEEGKLDDGHGHQANIQLLCSVTKKVKVDDVLCYVNVYPMQRNYVVNIYKSIKKLIYKKELNERPLQAKAGGSRSSSPNVTHTDPLKDHQKELLPIIQDISQIFSHHPDHDDDHYTTIPFEMSDVNLNQLQELFNVKLGAQLVTGPVASWITNLVMPTQSSPVPPTSHV